MSSHSTSAPAYLSADDFLTGIMGGEADVEIEGLGIVRVRSLEVAEVYQASTETKGNEFLTGMIMISQAMVEPKLTREHVAQLNRARPGVITALLTRIKSLSGMDDNAEKKVGTGF